MRPRTLIVIFALMAGIGSLIGVIAVPAVNHLVKTSPTVARKVNGPMPVQVVAAEPIHLTEIVGANGLVQPIALVNITARPPEQVETATRVQGVAVDLGDAVSPGQTLIQFDRELLSAAHAKAESAIEQATGDVQRARQQLQRINAIYVQGLLAKVEVEQAQAALQAATAAYSTAKAQLLRAKKDLENATVVSLVSGIIMERLVNAGETPQPDQQLLTIGQIDQVLVETKVAEDRLGDVQLQQPAIVTFNAFPNDVLEGKVVKIKPLIDQETKTFPVYIQIANPARKYKPGLAGFVRIKRQHEVLAVPSVSLINPTGGQESSVFVVDGDSHVRLKKVKVGVVAEGMTQIVDGLTRGDRVVVVGHLYLRDGDLVRVGDEFDELKNQG